MQDVKRGEVALWVVCSDREGHSKAWPAVRMQGRGLRATFLLRFLRQLRLRTRGGERWNRDLAVHESLHPLAWYLDEVTWEPTVALHHVQVLRI